MAKNPLKVMPERNMLSVTFGLSDSQITPNIESRKPKIIPMRNTASGFFNDLIDLVYYKK